MGVFATRSPFRPNPIGLSSVKLERVEYNTKEGAVLHVSGADLLDGTPIYDIKPYLAFTDSHADATGGFSDGHIDDHLEVEFPDELLLTIPQERRAGLVGVLSGDPRPSYQDDAERVYGLDFAGYNIEFTVKDGKLTVCGVKAL